MKRITILVIFFIITLPLYSSEKKADTKTHDTISMTFNINTVNSTALKTEKFAMQSGSPNTHLIAGITLTSVGGLCFFLLSPVFIGCGVYLITYAKRKTAYSGTTAQRTYYTYPYRDQGIVLAVFGGIFFLSGIGLIIAGIVNFVLAYKDRYGYLKSKRDKRLTLVSFVDMKNNSSGIALKYRFYTP